MDVVSKKFGSVQQNPLIGSEHYPTGGSHVGAKHFVESCW